MPAPAKNTLAATRAVPRRSRNVGNRMTPTRETMATAMNSRSAYRPYTKRRGTEITAGQRTADLGGGNDIRSLFLEERADSCELVLFMLMVSGSCEGRHA